MNLFHNILKVTNIIIPEEYALGYSRNSVFVVMRLKFLRFGRFGLNQV